jgi:hypothetical protein
MDLLIHGVFDALTLKNLQKLNCKRIGFDLRGQSLNLVPFHVLKSLIPLFKDHKNYLIFENDRLDTIESFLSLLGDHKQKFELEFRDAREAGYYSSLKHPFSWFFHPQGDWKNILLSPYLTTLILPIRLQSTYYNLPHFWEIIRMRNLQVVLHVESFSELEFYLQEKNLTMSVDLGKELEICFRQIDQSRLANLGFWRMKNETASGQ